MQSIVISGNIGSDPTLRQAGDYEVCTLNLAVNDWKSSKEEASEPLWIKVSVWGNQAKACHENLSKGDKIIVNSNRMTLEQWTDKETGEPRSQIALNAWTVEFC